jgi:hypothetical protein
VRDLQTLVSVPDGAPWKAARTEGLEEDEVDVEGAQVASVTSRYGVGLTRADEHSLDSLTLTRCQLCYSAAVVFCRAPQTLHDMLDIIHSAALIACSLLSWCSRSTFSGIHPHRRRDAGGPCLNHPSPGISTCHSWTTSTSIIFSLPHDCYSSL